MADPRRNGGQSVNKHLRTRSASFSSESSGVSGGAPLHVTMSDLDLQNTPLKRSASFMATTRAAEPTYSATTSAGFAEPISDNTQQHFQVGKPPHDDEQVFGTLEPIPTETMSRQLPAGLLPANQAGTHRVSAVVPIYTQPSPAEKRHLVSGVDAQTYYPPEACVFVANLPEAKSDTALEVGVTKTFSAFGPVFVKIRRDHKNMPFAFCQYTDPKHAERAQLEGKGLLVEGRACRTEMVKANRSYVIFHLKQIQVSLAEAQSHLSQFGEIEELKPLNEEAAKIMNTPGAVYVRYKYFDPARDIISAYRYHDQFNVMAYDLKKSRGNLASNNINYLARYEIDRRSIYVGNLPYEVENLEDILREAASVGGTVDSVQVIRKPPKNEGGRPMVFAFVVYERPDEALGAVERLRGTALLGNRLRVEKKNCLEQGAHFRSPGTQDAVVQHTQHPVPDIKSENSEEIPVTPNHPATGTDDVGEGKVGPAGTADNKAKPNAKSVSPDPVNRPRGMTPRRTFATPMAYHQGVHNNFASPNNGYHGNGFNGQPGYPPQYPSPGPGYAPRYMSPNYTMTPGYNPHARTPYGHGGYTPATPHMNLGVDTPYPGHGGPYYPPETSPEGYWATPYLQDGAEGYRYFAGYGPQRTPMQRTPMQPAARSVNVINAGQTPTRATEQPAQQQKPAQTTATEQQTGKDAGEDVVEKK